MNFNQARKILGLEAGEDPRSQMHQFTQLRERVARMVREAPNPTMAARYQDQLMEMDQALAACREYLEALGFPIDDASTAPITEASKQPLPPQRRGKRLWIATTISICILGSSALAVWFFYERELEMERQIQARIDLLETEGKRWIESRRWDDAKRVFDQIRQLSPTSRVAQDGYAAIDRGQQLETSQFIAYWTGQAIAECEAGRFDEAESAARKILQEHPGHPDSLKLLERIDRERSEMALKQASDKARELLDLKDWQSATDAAQEILDQYPGNADAVEILSLAKEGIATEAKNRSRASELYRMAKERDHGEFDPQAVDWLREAVSLDPDNTAIASLLQTMSAYVRTLHVPDDYITASDALAAAREGDRILLAAGTWTGPLIVDIRVDIEGEGPEKTIIECPPDLGSPLSIGPNAKDVRVRGLRFRHSSFRPSGSERFSAAIVSGGSATILDCEFTDASGHGLAVVNQGSLSASRCKFSDNSWNGISVSGQGSRLEVRDSLAMDNFGHGIESWDGASTALFNNRCDRNSRNGIHIDNKQSEASIVRNRIAENREFGIVITSAGEGRVNGNQLRANLLGGMLIRNAAAAVEVGMNHARDHGGPGLIIEKGLEEGRYSEVKITGTHQPQVLSNADFSIHVSDDAAAEASMED